VFPGGEPDLQGLFAQAQQLQQQLAEAQEELAKTQVTGSAGGGLVTATVNGAGELLSLDIDPKAVDLDDLESLADTIVAAVRDANSKSADLQATRMGSVTEGLTGGLGLPGLPGMPGAPGAAELPGPQGG
jgi:DNA-binding YbaB/EbfC family protein